MKAIDILPGKAVEGVERGRALAAGTHRSVLWDRNARFEDPFDNEWSVVTHVKEVSEREMKTAMAQMGGAG